MIYPLLPVFLTSTLGATPLIVGLIEGSADALSSILKLAAGWLSDHLPKRKPLIVGGYALATLSRAWISVAGHWPSVLSARLLDRTGKGIRSAPRDAMIADVTPFESRGKAFGFHRALDHTGAVIGPLLAIFFLDAIHLPMRTVFMIAVIPGAVGVVLLMMGLREQRVAAAFRPPSGGLKPAATRVLLWPDTFNNYFHPDTAIAAAEVLESAGYNVVIPKKSLCCGRPLYDWGFLDAAKKLLMETMKELEPEIDRGTPIVGLEPSCISVFRDELHNLFPGRVLPMMTLSEFIQHAGDSFHIPRLQKKAIVQGHCHHKAIMKFEPEEHVLQKMGLEFEHLDSGCCGMAGAFGFERKHYEISMRIGERVLLPRVRNAKGDTLIIADGFSCREQITQATGRKALHLAEVLQMAMRSASS